MHRYPAADGRGEQGAWDMVQPARKPNDMVFRQPRCCNERQRARSRSRNAKPRRGGRHYIAFIIFAAEVRASEESPMKAPTANS